MFLSKEFEPVPFAQSLWKNSARRSESGQNERFGWPEPTLPDLIRDELPSRNDRWSRPEDRNPLPRGDWALGLAQ